MLSSCSKAVGWSLDSKATLGCCNSPTLHLHYIENFVRYPEFCQFFCPRNITIEDFYCNIFTEFQCYIVLSVLPRVWSHCDEHFCRKYTKHTCAVDVWNIVTYLLINENDMNIKYSQKLSWKFTVIHGKVIKKPTVLQFKVGIFLNFVKNPYFRYKDGFCQKRNTLEHTHCD